MQILNQTAPYSMADIELFGGAVTTAAASDETAWPHRDALWNIGILLLVPVEDGYDVYEETVATINKEWPKIMKYLDGVYLNYPMESLSKDEYPKQYWGNNLPRLMEIKASV